MLGFTEEGALSPSFINDHHEMSHAVKSEFLTFIGVLSVATKPFFASSKSCVLSKGSWFKTAAFF